MKIRHDACRQVVSVRSDFDNRSGDICPACGTLINGYAVVADKAKKTKKKKRSASTTTKEVIRET